VTEPSSHLERITAYFDACESGSAAEIASHFTDDAVIYDTNIRPMVSAAGIGADWVKVRDRWMGARWTVDSILSEGDAAAIEWSMRGTEPVTGRDFVFRGSEHYRFDARTHRIAEIRQYWTFDPEHLDTGLIDFPY
jgi:ketosteroid isomerase-like protein